MRLPAPTDIFYSGHCRSDAYKMPSQVNCNLHTTGHKKAGLPNPGKSAFYSHRISNFGFDTFSPDLSRRTRALWRRNLKCERYTQNINTLLLQDTDTFKQIEGLKQRIVANTTIISFSSFSSFTVFFTLILGIFFRFFLRLGVAIG